MENIPNFQKILEFFQCIFMIEEKIRQFIEKKALTIKGVEDAAGLKQSTLSKALKNGGSLGSDKLEKILMAYPELSAEWLFRGEGEMLKGETNNYSDKELIDICKTLVDINEHRDSAMRRLTTLIKNMEG